MTRSILRWSGQHLINIVLKIIVIALWSQIAIGSTPSRPMRVALITENLQRLEHQRGATIGLYAIDTNNGTILSYRGNQTFPFQSTFKLMGVAALLHHDQSKPTLQKKIFIAPEQLVMWHPISGLYLNQKASFHTLAEGAISYSDNTAINLIIRELGGLDTINQFARRVANTSFNLKHYEVNLNSNPANDEDSSTPKDMAISLQNILLGDVLNERNRQLLLHWMQNNTTGDTRIRAGVPPGWVVADKTGSGGYGIANDIGIVWSPSCKPIILSIYTHQNTQGTSAQEDLIAHITQMTLEQFSTYNGCFKASNLAKPQTSLMHKERP